MSNIQNEEGEYLDINNISMLVIANAGDSTSYSMEAIKVARDGNFDESKNLLEKSKEALHKAHEIHTQILVEEARGGLESISMILVHASNHFSMAEMTLEFAKTIVELYERI